MPKRYPPKLKFQVVLEVLTGEKSVGQAAKIYGVHPNSVNGWKQGLLEKGHEIFARDGTISEYEQHIAKLEQLLGKKECSVSVFADCEERKK